MRIGKIGLQRFSSLREKSGTSKMPDATKTAQIKQQTICLCIVGNTINLEKNTYAKKEIQRGKFRKMLSEPVLARRAAMFMAKRDLLSELIRSFW